MRSSRNPRALVSHPRASTSSPVRILSEQAHMAEEEHDYPTAEQDYRQALALGDSSCANCFAGLLLNEEKFTQAIPVLSQALDDDPDDTGMRANRAHAYLTTGKFHEALADLAIGADEGDAYSQGELGRLNMQGIPGVLEPDPQTGIEWLKKSAAQGNEAAIHNLQIAQQMVGYAAKPQ
jgi:tetratricopeptide (TPR) repeat protein